ncbi:MAG: hypothetical protein J5843_01035 [Clostridia bacterium]|nr:hypothetical protein [Clostridia bacterium]
MARDFKKTLAVLLCFGLLVPAVGLQTHRDAFAKNAVHQLSWDVKGAECPTTAADGLVVYQAGKEARKLYSKDYKFRNSYLMVFDSDGRLAEIGSHLLEENGVQLSVTVPAGGFMIAFPYAGYIDLYQAFTVAQEGAMYYNHTFTVGYEMFGEYDAKKKTFALRYDDPVPAPADAVRFLFIGNSTTYVNACPIKFRELAKAAGKPVEVTYCTEGSAYLEYFAEGGQYDARFKAALKKQRYDYVVLQDAAGADYTKASKALKSLIPQIRENGATPVFYMRYYSDKSSCYELTEKYFSLYEALARDYNTVYAPVVVAFLRCQERYPDINLYADDYSHHSKEGSYLIACTWLYAFLGISPVGNAYTAGLDARTAAALQECAASSIEEPYRESTPTSSFTEDGNEYTNVALGKSYTRTGSPYTRDDNMWSDTDSATGKSLGKMTDGFTAAAGDDNAIAAYKGSEGAPTDVLIDLEAPYGLRAFETDLFGGTWGIADPGEAVISVSVSADGETFTEVGELACAAFKTNGSWTSGKFSLHLAEDVVARYVKFSYRIAASPYFCWTSEAVVYGTEWEPEYDLGDINGSGEVSALDYLIVKKTVLKTYTPRSKPEERRMNVNGDAGVNLLDCRRIKQICFGQG